VHQLVLLLPLKSLVCPRLHIEEVARRVHILVELLRSVQGGAELLEGAQVRVETGASESTDSFVFGSRLPELFSQARVLIFVHLDLLPLQNVLD